MLGRLFLFVNGCDWVTRGGRGYSAAPVSGGWVLGPGGGSLVGAGDGLVGYLWVLLGTCFLGSRFVFNELLGPNPIFDSFVVVWTGVWRGG